MKSSNKILIFLPVTALIATIMLCAFSINSNGSIKQAPHEVLNQEKTLSKQANSLMESASSYPETGSTSKEDQFVKKFVRVLANANTFNYDFPFLKKYNITLLKSADKRLKIYSWQSPYSGSMWHTQNILQYLGNDRRLITASFNNLYKQKDDGTGPSPILDKVYKINNAGANQYLLIGYGQMSGTEPYSVAHMLNTANHRFNINKKVFVINNRPENEIYVSVTVGEDQDIDEIRKKMDIKFESTSQRLVYPVTKVNGNNLMLTGATQQIQFKNGVFK
jgi:hypothetical protein